MKKYSIEINHDDIEYFKKDLVEYNNANNKAKYNIQNGKIYVQLRGRNMYYDSEIDGLNIAYTQQNEKTIFSITFDNQLFIKKSIIMYTILTIVFIALSFIKWQFIFMILLFALVGFGNTYYTYNRIIDVIDVFIDFINQRK